jgi:hypothetical protein
MIHPNASGDAAAHAADNATIRSCSSSAGQEDQADPRLPDDHRPQLRRGAARARLAAAHREAQGRDAAQLEAGEDVIIAGSVSNDEAKQKYPDGWKSPKPYLRIVPQPK